jgi:repressor of nif and glnA expression
MNRTMLAILKVLEKTPDNIVGSREISRQLTNYGIDLTERTVRYHLRILDEKGFTKVYGKEGRKITLKGKEELSEALVSEKVGFVISKIQALSFLSDFDITNQNGKVILNVTFFRKNIFRNALKIMKGVFSSKYSMSDRVIAAESGEYIGDIKIPEDHVGFGTVCSATINSILLKAGIPITSKFGGVLQIEDGDASRFVALISYDGSSLDPHEIFIKSGMTDVHYAIKNSSGKILASFREIPVVCIDRVHELRDKMESVGIGGILMIGNPNQQLLEMPVGIDKVGLVVVGGLNPIAAVEESGIATRSRAMSTLYDYENLVSFKELL